VPKMPSGDLNYVGKLHSGSALFSCIMFLINHRWLHHFWTWQCYQWSNMGMNVLKIGGCVPNCDCSNELPGFIRCEKFLNELNNWKQICLCN